MGLKNTLAVYAEKYPKMAWTRSLDWHDGTPNAQTLPEPFIEVDQRAWWLATYCSPYSPLEVVYDQLFLDGHNTMFAQRRNDPVWKPGPTWQCNSPRHARGRVDSRKIVYLRIQPEAARQVAQDVIRAVRLQTGEEWLHHAILSNWLPAQASNGQATRQLLAWLYLLGLWLLLRN